VRLIKAGAGKLYQPAEGDHQSERRESNKITSFYLLFYTTLKQRKMQNSILTRTKHY